MYVMEILKKSHEDNKLDRIFLRGKDGNEIKKEYVGHKMCLLCFVF